MTIGITVSPQRTFPWLVMAAAAIGVTFSFLIAADGERAVN